MGNGKTAKNILTGTVMVIVLLIQTMAWAGEQPDTWAVKLDPGLEPVINALKSLADWGGYMAAGSARAAGADDDDMLVVLMDQGGEGYESFTLGAEHNEVAWDIEETMDGGFVVVGGRGDATRDSWDVLVTRLNENGDQLWERTFGGELFEWGEVVAETLDRGLVVAGARAGSAQSVESDIWVIKLDHDGNLVWDSVLDGQGAEEIYGIREILDGGILLTGWSAPEETPVSWAAMIDPMGQRLWELSVDGFIDRVMEYPNENCLLLSGWKAVSARGGYEIWFLMLDEGGNVLWEKKPGELAEAVNADYRQVIEAEWSEKDQKPTLNILRYDMDGEVEWEQSIPCGDFANPCAHLEDSEGGVIIAGKVDLGDESNYMIMKLDEYGACRGQGCP